jgi:hypothetical protein
MSRWLSRLTASTTLLAIVGLALHASAEVPFVEEVNSWCALNGRTPSAPISTAVPGGCETCHKPFTFDKINVVQPAFDEYKDAKKINDFSWFCPGVTPQNRPPVLAPIGPRSGSEGGTLTFTVSASDADGDRLRFTASDLPRGATFVDRGNGSAEFRWTPGFDQSGNYRVTFRVEDDGAPVGSDAEESVITIGNQNRPPTLATIGGHAAQEGQSLGFTVSASDPDGDALVFAALGLPTGARFTDNGNGTARLEWTPGFDRAGNYPMTITVTDRGTPAASDSESFTITVGDVNRPPVLSTIGNRDVAAGQALGIDLSASDPDGNSLSFSAADLPQGASFTDQRNGSARFSWQPRLDQSGSYRVTFSVTDDARPMASDSETITITVGAVNRPPVLDPIGNRTIDAGQTLSVALTARDPDGNRLTFSSSGLPSGALLTPGQNGTAQLSWTPSAVQVGNHRVTFTVVDDGAPMGSDFEEVTLTVVAQQQVNRPPVLDPVGNRSVLVGEPLTIRLTASDPDGDALRYSIEGTPAGASLTDRRDGTAELGWTPAAGQVGNHSVTFRVTDLGTPTETDFERITITVGAINRPPTLDPIGDQTGRVGETLRLSLHARDPDGNAVRFGLTGLPNGARFTDQRNGTALVEWTPSAAGTYRLMVTVEDDGAPRESAAQSFSIQVRAVEPPPAPGGTGVGDFHLRRAFWHRGHAMLFADGRGAPGGAEVEIVDAASGEVLGHATAHPRGHFRVRVRPFVAPCQVKARVDGVETAALSVLGAPDTCGEPGVLYLRLYMPSWNCARSELRVRGSRAPDDAVIVVDGAEVPLERMVDRHGRFDIRETLSSAPSHVEVGVVVDDEVWMLDPMPVRFADRVCRPRR